jgi:hypothetical protein
MQLCELNWDVGFGVLTALIMNAYIFCDLTPCSPLKVNRSFGGTFRLPFSGLKNKPSMTRQSSALFATWYIIRFVLRPWRWRRHVPPKCRLIFNGLHDVISQKTQLWNEMVKDGAESFRYPIFWIFIKNVKFLCSWLSTMPWMHVEEERHSSTQFLNASVVGGEGSSFTLQANGGRWRI